MSTAQSLISQEIITKFQETKNALSKRQLNSALDHWESPVFKPIKPKHTGELVRLVSILQNNYLSRIGTGVEVSSENLNDESWVLEAVGHTFKLPVSMGLALKNQGKAWLYEANGYTFISTIEQREAYLAYLEHTKQFEAFSRDLIESDRFLRGEIQAEIAIAQHEMLQKLPFDYYVAIKVNVRLLTESSWGDGAKRNTVMHIVPNEELTGRLKRKANEYLCGGISSFGSPTENQDAILNNSAHGLHKPEITCKSCLEKAMRILNQVPA